MPFIDRGTIINASIELQVVWKGLMECYIAGKIEDFYASENPLVKAMRHYAERRLVQDHPIIEEDLKQ